IYLANVLQGLAKYRVRRVGIDLELLGPAPHRPGDTQRGVRDALSGVRCLLSSGLLRRSLVLMGHVIGGALGLATQVAAEALDSGADPLRRSAGVDDDVRNTLAHLQHGVAGRAQEDLGLRRIIEPRQRVDLAEPGLEQAPALGLHVAEVGSDLE